MADVVAAPYGSTSAWPNPPGTSVTRYSLSAGELTVDLIDLGARVVSVTMPDRAGKVDQVCLSLPSLAAYEDLDRNLFFGDTIGRYANRIAGAHFALDGVDYRLDANNGPNHLHGGRSGFGRRVWHSEPFDDAEGAGVEFSYRSPHLEEGYPGELFAVARTTLRTDGTLTFEFSATSDRPTVVSLTNHTYWNLAGSGTIADHVLTVRADRYLPVGDTGIPTPDAPASVGGTGLDLRTERLITELASAGIDHCYLPGATSGIEYPQATVRHPASGRRLDVWTDQPGIQCYTGQYLAPPDFVPYAGLCLEPQQLPDAPNRPDFPSPVLRAGGVYTATTVIRLSVEA